MKYILSAVFAGLILWSCDSQRRLFEATQRGEQLHTVREYTVDSVLVTWLHENGSADTPGTIRELYCDSTFLYLGGHNPKFQAIFKVRIDSLNRIDYKAIHRDSIIKQFKKTFIPPEDTAKVTQWPCRNKIVWFAEKFHTTPHAHIIRVTMHYNANCRYRTILSKRYVAYYDTRDGRWVNVR